MENSLSSQIGKKKPSMALGGNTKSPYVSMSPSASRGMRRNNPNPLESTYNGMMIENSYQVDRNQGQYNQPDEKSIRSSNINPVQSVGPASLDAYSMGSRELYGSRIGRSKDERRKQSAKKSNFGMLDTNLHKAGASGARILNEPISRTSSRAAAFPQHQEKRNTQPRAKSTFGNED